MVAESEEELAMNPSRWIGELNSGVTNLENVFESERDLPTTNCKAMPKETDTNQTGCKRVRVADDEQTSVRIVYKSLTRKSKKKLEELLYQWSEWHAEQCSLNEGLDEDIESGEETYFPALCVGQDKSCTVTFYMDNEVKKKQRTDDISIGNGSEPVYDRDFAFALTSDDGSANKGSGLDMLNAPRCFNCDSYSHSLKDCPKPFNKDAVNKARKLHQLKSNRTAGPRVLTRYYQNTPGGKFDGLKPGCLDPETRKLLSLGEYDPPPWLHKMREMGYPPGYLDSEDVQPSGITIYADGEQNKECLIVSASAPKKKMSMEFPGINAPIPANADRSLWTAPSQPTGFKSYNNSLLSHRPNSIIGSDQGGHSHLPPWQNGCRQESDRPPWQNGCRQEPVLPPWQNGCRQEPDLPPWWNDRRQEPDPRAHPDFGRNYQHHAPETPLMSNYANRYWDHINHYSPYAYRNS